MADRVLFAEEVPPVGFLPTHHYYYFIQTGRAALFFFFVSGGRSNHRPHFPHSSPQTLDIPLSHTLSLPFSHVATPTPWSSPSWPPVLLCLHPNLASALTPPPTSTSAHQLAAMAILAAPGRAKIMSSFAFAPSSMAGLMKLVRSWKTRGRVGRAIFRDLVLC